MGITGAPARPPAPPGTDGAPNATGSEDPRLGRLPEAGQAELLGALLAAAEAAPFRRQETARGAMSALQTSVGALGWTSDRTGYRYAAKDPVTGRPWPPIPEAALRLWRALLPGAPDPDSGLLNLYRGSAAMGLHRDLDERDRRQPVLSVSLGEDAEFRLGGPRRGDPVRRLLLRSGDVVVLRGADRLAHHGVGRPRAGTSGLVPGGGRLNLTLRVAG